MNLALIVWQPHTGDKTLPEVSNYSFNYSSHEALAEWQWPTLMEYVVERLNNHNSWLKLKGDHLTVTPNVYLSCVHLIYSFVSCIGSISKLLYCIYSEFIL